MQIKRTINQHAIIYIYIYVLMDNESTQLSFCATLQILLPAASFIFQGAVYLCPRFDLSLFCVKGSCVFARVVSLERLLVFEYDVCN